MDIQNAKSNGSKSIPNSKSSIEEAQMKILKLQIQVMQIVCATFYNNEHRCLLSYVTACTLQKQQIKEEDLSIFQNYLSLIVDLKDGYFLTSYQKLQKKQGKRDKKITYYRLNTKVFFKLIRPILTELQNKLKKIKEFYLENQKNQSRQGEQKKVYKRCKVCHTRQNIHLQMFGFEHCEKCRGTDFEDVVINQKQKIRIEKLNQITSVVFSKMKDIQNMEYKRRDQIEEIKQIQKNTKVKEIDRFMKPYEQFLKEKGEKIDIKIDLKVIKQAEKTYAPLKEFAKVKEMIHSRQLRERTRQKNNTKQSGQQSKKFKSS